MSSSQKAQRLMRLRILIGLGDRFIFILEVSICCLERNGFGTI